MFRIRLHVVLTRRDIVIPFPLKADVSLTMYGEVELHASLTSTPDGVCGQLHISTVDNQGKNP
jgi:hypothetical protein